MNSVVEVLTEKKRKKKFHPKFEPLLLKQGPYHKASKWSSTSHVILDNFTCESKFKSLVSVCPCKNYTPGVNFFLFYLVCNKLPWLTQEAEKKKKAVHA